MQTREMRVNVANGWPVFGLLIVLGFLIGWCIVHFASQVVPDRGPRVQAEEIGRQIREFKNVSDKRTSELAEMQRRLEAESKQADAAARDSLDKQKADLKTQLRAVMTKDAGELSALNARLQEAQAAPKQASGILPLIVAIFAALCWGVSWGGFFTVQPNVAVVLMLFGKYKGTGHASGLRWANPFYSKTKVSQRIRNINGTPIKVNDLRGNPIEIAAVVVWHVEDTAQAIFDVDKYEQYVTVQIESALRHLAMAYPYDVFEGDTLSLRGSTDEISAALKNEVQERMGKAGIVIDEARLSHLAYAPEIAGAMLQRQQAEAVVAARTRIVDGAVGMVELALKRLEQEKTIELDGERKAAMVSNLLVVLCAHEPARPVINAGTLYS